MNDIEPAAAHRPPLHQHIFLGAGHEKNERNTWTVIWLCGAMMILEIAGGIWFGSIALVADGLHMSTHAGAMLLAALAYSFARKHADDPRFSFGTGKLGDLAGFSSAIILAMISLLIFYEAISRLLDPVKIHFREAIPIAFLGLCVNIVSAWLLSRGGHTHDHGHAHGHDHGHGPPAEHPCRTRPPPPSKPSAPTGNARFSNSSNAAAFSSPPKTCPNPTPSSPNSTKTTKSPAWCSRNTPMWTAKPAATTTCAPPWCT